MKLSTPINHSLLQTTCSLLEDARTYLRDISIDAYTSPVPCLEGISVGQHTRHFIEFFQCFAEQLQFPSYRLNYDLRARDLSLETDPQSALDAIDILEERIAAMGVFEILLLQSTVLGGQKSVIVHTYSDREILYLIDHTLHHLALVKVGLYFVAPHLQLPEHFGVAPSTMQYRKRLNGQVAKI